MLRTLSDEGYTVTRKRTQKKTGGVQYEENIARYKNAQKEKNSKG